MSPIEILWITLIAIFGMLGAARGYPRELGVTAVIFVALLVLKQFGEPMVTFLDTQLGPILGFRILQQPNSDITQFLIYTGLFLAVVFASYAGETFSFPGKPARGRVGSLISIANGLVNGYLVTGTIWHYLDEYNYPLERWGLLQLPLTPLAQEMVKYLPPRILNQTVLIGLISILILLRIRK